MRVLAACVGPGAERVAGARQHDRADVVATAGAQSSRFASMLGSMMVSVALAFAVLEITDSATALGLVLAAHTIPMVIFLLFGGVIADRFPRTLIMQVSGLLTALTQGAVAFLVITGTAELWMVIALEAVNGMVSTVSFPAMAGIVPQLVPRASPAGQRAAVDVPRWLAIIGPTVAALLVVGVGPGWALAVDACTWLLAAAFISRVAVPARKQRSADDPPSSMVHELREGWTVFAGNTWLWVVVVAFAVLNAIHTGAWFTLGPALAKDTIGAKGWGYVLSAESMGLLLMTCCYGCASGTTCERECSAAPCSGHRC